MTDHMNQRDETHLDDLFAEARQVRPVVSVDLMARIMADAAAVQSERTAPIVVAAPEQGGFFAGLWTASAAPRLTKPPFHTFAADGICSNSIV